ncbi:MAG: DUF2961 domain-containing protein [Christensenellales bacterium]
MKILYNHPAMVTGCPARLINVSWNMDKYPDAPTLKAGSIITVLDSDGPGIITNIHATAYCFSTQDGQPAAPKDPLWIRVYYDYKDEPAIDMPMDAFLGDPESSCVPYSTVFFSKFNGANNSYLSLPFFKHIRVEIENRSSADSYGYMTMQVEPLEQWNPLLGQLHVGYCCGNATLPDDILRLLSVHGRGTLVAHWLELSTSYVPAMEGELLCEGNNEIYIDEEETPSYEYLGTEDLYGSSWGFQRTQCDGRSGIIRKDKSDSGLKLTMLRTREADRIRFNRSVRFDVNYQQEYFSVLSVNPHCMNMEKHQFEMSFRSCCYYYLILDELSN